MLLDPYVNEKLCKHHICRVKHGKCLSKAYPKIKIFSPQSKNTSKRRQEIREQIINRNYFNIWNLARLASKYSNYESSEKPGWSYLWRTRSGMAAPVLNLKTSASLANKFLNDDGFNPVTRYVVIICGSDEFTPIHYQKLVLDMSNYRGLVIYYKNCDLSQKTARNNGEGFATIYKYCEPLQHVSTKYLSKTLRQLPGVNQDVDVYDFTIGSGLYLFRDKQECQRWRNYMNAAYRP